jgi:hypothetical protein
MKDCCSTNSHNFTCCGEGKVGALGLYVSTGKGIPELPGSTTYQKYTIRGATQKFGEFDHKKKLITLTPIFHCLLRSSPLGHVYSDPSVFP